MCGLLFTFLVAGKTLFDSLGVLIGRGAFFVSGRQCLAGKKKTDHHGDRGFCAGGKMLPVGINAHVPVHSFVDFALERFKTVANRLMIDASISMIFAVRS